ncbi:uncharacterized protein LOC143578547 [Bidens hawaiensis]|uniref:uncharacterized protein LOC143578547 n=1 Tax=Bidens hawaiensis TaxID=980011 RepID=UPI00404B070B
MSIECIGIMVGDGKTIAEEIKLSWREKSYVVWVTEDLGMWDPECSGRVEKEVEEGSRATVRLESGATKTPAMVGVGENEGSETLVGNMGNLHAINEKLVEEKEGHLEEEYQFGGMENLHNNEEGPPAVLTFDSKSNNKTCRKKKKNKNKKSRGSVSANLSPDRPRAKKRPRNNDPFGLDVLLGLNRDKEIFSTLDSRSKVGNKQNTEVADKEMQTSRTNIEEVDEEEGEGNIDLCVEEEDDLWEMQVDNTEDLEITVSDFEKEISATIEVGAKIGAEVGNFMEMVKDSIKGDGVEEVIQ